jgi:hypothetical protein
MNIPSPTTEEYAPFYSDYVERMQDKDVLHVLERQIDELKSALIDRSEEHALYRFGPKEWSIKELVGHLNDAERIFSYRMLCISRKDTAPLPGFEQDDFVRESGSDSCALNDLLSEFEFLRRANILAIRSLSDDALLRRGTAGGATVSVRALVHIIPGHVEHHLQSLRVNYLSAIDPA